MQNKWFTNWTNESFTYPWDNEIFTFEAGESKLLPAYLSDHFAKHLVDRVLTLDGKVTNHPSRESLMEKCFVDASGFAPSSEDLSSVKAEIEALNVPMKKRGRPKKLEVSADENFDGLNVNEAVSA